MRKLQTFKGSNYGLKADVLAAAIKEDRAQGFIPFFVVATVSTYFIFFFGGDQGTKVISRSQAYSF
jgi:hypothetical protein